MRLRRLRESVLTLLAVNHGLTPRYAHRYTDIPYPTVKAIYTRRRLPFNPPLSSTKRRRLISSYLAGSSISDLCAAYSLAHVLVSYHLRNHICPPPQPPPPAPIVPVPDLPPPTSP